jgi:ABC-type dipeptide/oligopeptide/nickel transport system permease subunit
MTIMSFSETWRQARFTPDNGVWARVRSLGIMRVVFVVAIFIVYASLLLVTVLTDRGPHERFRYNKNMTFNEDSMLVPGGVPGGAVEQSGFMVYAGPSKEHWLGNDERGRDLFTRLAYGARTSLATGAVCVVFFLIAGIGFGVVAGYYEGRWHSFFVYIFNLVNTFPILLLLLLSVIVIGSFVGGEWTYYRIYPLMACLGFFSSPKLAELIRGQISSLKETAFVQASVALGLKPYQIIGKHILWYECRPLIVVQSAYMMGQAILVETTLTFLHFGLDYPLVSWGLMFKTMSGGIMTGRYQPVIVMATIAVAVYFFHYLAGILNDWLSAEERQS